MIIMASALLVANTLSASEYPWTWEVSWYSVWNPSDMDVSKVSGTLQYVEGNNSGYIEVELSPDYWCPGCAYTPIEPGLYLYERQTVLYIALWEPDMPPDESYVVWIADIGWSRRHHEIWFEVDRINERSWEYTFYDCDEDVVLRHDTMELRHPEHESGYFIYEVFALEYYHESFDAVGLARMGEVNEFDIIDMGSPSMYWYDPPSGHQKAVVEPVAAACRGPNESSQMATNVHELVDYEMPAPLRFNGQVRIPADLVPPPIQATWTPPAVDPTKGVPTGFTPTPRSATLLATESDYYVCIPMVTKYHGADWYQMKGWWVQ